MKTCSMCKLFKETSEFSKNRSKKDGLQALCKVCCKAQHRDYYSANKERMSKQIYEAKKRRSIEVRQTVYNYQKQHPCVDCGETDPVLLQFDHIKPGKRMAVSAMLSGDYATSTVLAEIMLCEVRCVTCHTRKTAKEQGWYVDLEL